MKHSTFLPIVSVSDDGTITVDWSDSYNSTVDESGDVTHVEDVGEPHSTLLDSILGIGGTGSASPTPRSMAASLRRLADHIDGATARGGYDGILLKFGEGTDDDSFNAVLGAYEVNVVTFDDGTVVTIDSPHFGHSDDGETVLRYRAFDEDAGEPTGDELTVPVERIVGWEVC